MFCGFDTDLHVPSQIQSINDLPSKPFTCKFSHMFSLETFNHIVNHSQLFVNKPNNSALLTW